MPLRSYEYNGKSSTTIRLDNAVIQETQNEVNRCEDFALFRYKL